MSGQAAAALVHRGAHVHGVDEPQIWPLETANRIQTRTLGTGTDRKLKEQWAGKVILKGIFCECGTDCPVALKFGGGCDYLKANQGRDAAGRGPFSFYPRHCRPISLMRFGDQIGSAFETAESGSGHKWGT